MNRRHSRQNRRSSANSRRLLLQNLEHRHLFAADGLVVAPDSAATWANSSPVLINVLANDTFDSDYAGNRRVTSVSTGSLGGRIEITNSGSEIRYTPPANLSGVESFSYTVDDRKSATVAVDVRSPLQPFEITIDHFRNEYQFDLLANAVFPDGYTGAKRITLTSDTALGSELRITADGKSVIYVNDGHQYGNDSFTYIVDDLYVGTAKVTSINPLASDSYEVIQNTDATILSVLDNDFRSRPINGLSGVVSEATWETVRTNARITHVLDDAKGEVEISTDGRSLVFTPVANESGYRNFRYVVDGRYETSFSVIIQRPVVDDYLNADVDGGAHTLDVLKNDEYRSIYRNSPVRIVERVTSVTQGDKGGTVSVSADGRAVSYTPANGFIGTETFEYVADGKHTAKVAVQVTQPVRDDSFTVYHNANNVLDVLKNDFTAEAPVSRAITSVTESTLGAEVRIQGNGSILYTPPSNWSQEDYKRDTFSYTVNNQYTAIVSVWLGRLTSFDFVRIDSPATKVIDVLSNDLFATNYLGNRAITGVTQPANGGSVVIDADTNTVRYTPGSLALDGSFTYTVDNLTTETVYVGAIPWLSLDTAVADQNGSAITVDVLSNDFATNDINFYGPYTGPRELSASSRSEKGGSVVVTPDKKVSYVPPVDFVGRDSFTYSIDNFLTQTVNVNVIRRAADDRVRVAPNSQNNVLNVLVNDIHGADYTGSGLITNVTSSTAGALISIAGDRRTLNYTPAAGFIGDDTFVYTIDGKSKATITVSVRDNAESPLGKFNSTEEFRDYVIGLAVERYKNQFGSRDYGTVYDSVSGVPRAALNQTADSSTRNEFSQTNVQVAGVDEHDIVETDGNFIYALRGNELTIVRSLPANDLALVSRTVIEGKPVGMYLSGERVSIISERVQSSIYPIDGIQLRSLVVQDSFAPWSVPSLPSSTIVTVLDIADRANPTIVQRTEFDGAFADSRRIDDQVFVILESDTLLPELMSSRGANNEYTFESEEQFKARLIANFASIMEQTLPGYESYDADGDLLRGGPLLMPEDIFRSGNDLLSVNIVASIDMQSNEPGLSAVAGVMANPSSKIFASESSLYVFNEFSESTENETWTGILKFDWSGETGGIEFAATGSVPGRVLNQFSADERDGLLRLTTEIQNSFTGNYSGKAETGVFVLQDDAGILEFVGGLQNLALGQNIKSVRYFDDRMFVTTFSSVDPLTAIDLSDPSNPRALGHVSIPGFSSYMQFVSPDRLLTIGTNTPTGTDGRAMVSLFDVSTLTSPRLIDQYNLPKYSTSAANSDHHAFGWFANHELLSVPVARHFAERHDADGDGYKESYRAVRADELSILHVGVDANGAEGITLRGQVVHDAQVDRSVSINGHIYSVGVDGIRVVNVNDANTIVDEVLFDWNIDSGDEPVVAFDHTVYANAARDLLAGRGVNRGSLLLVTQENHDGDVELVLRDSAKHYRLKGTSDKTLEVIDEAFAFLENVQHNEQNSLDANDDGKVTALDALLVINEMNRRGQSNSSVSQVLRHVGSSNSSFTDINGDGQITANDALRVINELARNQAQLLLSAEKTTSSVDEYFQHEDDARLF